MCKVSAKEVTVVKETGNLKKKSSILHKDNRKDATKASLKLDELYPNAGTKV